jgi:hypothetical protein
MHGVIFEDDNEMNDKNERRNLLLVIRIVCYCLDLCHFYWLDNKSTCCFISYIFSSYTDSKQQTEQDNEEAKRNSWDVNCRTLWTGFDSNMNDDVCNWILVPRRASGLHVVEVKTLLRLLYQFWRTKAQGTARLYTVLQYVFVSSELELSEANLIV